MIHEARIVRVDHRPPAPGNIKQRLGVSRGHWEGNTLVVETTNFQPGASATNIGTVGAPPGNRFPISEKMRLVERFTRLSNDFLLYEITTEDPTVLTRPWTARFPLKLDNSYRMLEYACIEGNGTLPDWINVSRAERAAEAKGAAKP
jgi:hypothetical protein